MIRKLLAAAVLLACLAVVATVLLLANLSRFVKTGVETGGSLILGVPTTLEDASVSLLGGTVGLDGLSLGSPEGFDAAEMLALGHAHTTVQISSLRRDEIVVREVVIDGPEITLEFADGKTNWGVLLEHLKREPTEEEKRAAKKLRVDRIAFSNGKIKVAGIPLAGAAGIPLPDLEITGLRTADGKAATVRNVLADVIASLYGSVLGAVKGVVPAEELEKLGAELASLAGEAGAAAEQAVMEAADKVEEALGEAGGSLEETGAAVGEAAKGAADKAKGAIEGLFGGDKEEH
jgi:hypothetical protein